MTVWEALDYLNTLVDDSDPDVDFTQIDHALQTAEAVRQAGQPRWLIAAGLIHDLGKVLCLFGEPQWAVVGDTFPVGCAFSDRAVYPEYFSLNPDSTHPIYSTENGIYEPHCGLDNVHMSWGHDEYIFHVVKDCLPIEALYALRYHSFYPWHKEGAYQHLANDRDRAMIDVGEGVQPVRPVFEERREAGSRDAPAVLRRTHRRIFPRAAEFLTPGQ